MDWNKFRSPLSLAKRMWSSEGQDLPAQEFSALYERVRSATNEIKPLWQLGGATNDYLRRNPGAFPAPLELARFLLSANHGDARIIGLKLLTRCDARTEEFFAEVIRALKQKDDGEICGGLHELSIWIDRKLQARSKYSPEKIRPLETALQSVADSMAADYNVEVATRLLGYLKELL
jgi:hypothetical protein